MITTIKQYRTERKARRAGLLPSGFAIDPGLLHPGMRPDQRAITAHSLKMGRYAQFITTGGGKAFNALEWSHQIARHTGKRVLLLAPLAVADQFVETEGPRWGYDIAYVRNQDEADATTRPVVVSNYERMHHFKPSEWVGVAADESSFLKGSSSKLRHLFNSMWGHTPFRLCATATPSPNDHDELGNHSQALGVLKWHEMITEFFIRDSQKADTLRLRGHAEARFWEWVASWAVCMSKPSDLGYDDTGFILPPLNIQHVEARIDHTQAHKLTDKRGQSSLFFMESLSATDLWRNKSLTLRERMEATAAIVSAKPNAPWCIWIETHEEADLLHKLLPGICEVRGSDDFDQKRAKLRAFSQGNERVLMTKLDIAGFGMNWQHCANTVFASLTYSFERTFQGIKRFHRYGQTQPVNVWMVSASNEGDLVRAYDRKEAQFLDMQGSMNAAMRKNGLMAVRKTESSDYNPTKPMRLPPFLSTKSPAASFMA